MLTALLEQGREIVLPIVAGPGLALQFRQWTLEDDLVPGPLGTANPGPDRQECRPDIMLVPMLAFDRTKYRLGYGGGFYDRTIAGFRDARHQFIAIGVAYAGLEIAELPKDPWDQPLDAILTEQGLFGGII